MLDYDKGMQMATPPEVLRDLHSVDAAEFVYPATIAAQLGVPAFSGHVEWSGAEFRVNGGNRARETITGRLVQNKDGSIRLDMDRRSTDINDPAVVRTVVILDYQDNEAVSPCRLLIRDEISLLPGKAPEVWTKELTDFSMSFTPTWGGVGDSPAWYVANPPDAMTMVVISNGSAHTVIRAGKVLAVPERFEPFASSGKQHNVWAVFVVIVVILFAPAWMWIRRKSTAS